MLDLDRCSPAGQAAAQDKDRAPPAGRPRQVKHVALDQSTTKLVLVLLVLM